MTDLPGITLYEARQASATFTHLEILLPHERITTHKIALAPIGRTKNLKSDRSLFCLTTEGPSRCLALNRAAFQVSMKSNTPTASH